MKHIERYGLEDSLKLWHMVQDAQSYLDMRLSQFKQTCDHHFGLIQAGYSQEDADYFKRESDALNRHIDANFTTFLNQNFLHEKIACSQFTSGLDMRMGGQIHPLKYLAALSKQAQKAGADIYFNSAALNIQKNANGYSIITAKGEVRAQKIILTGNGLMGGLHHKVDRHVVPLHNYIIAVKPEADNMPMQAPLAVSDTKFVVNYFRMTANGVFLFGGGERYLRQPSDIEALVKNAMLKLFPQLENAKVTHAWGGTLGITSSRIPYVHLGEDGLFIAAGFSGAGVLLAPYFGHLLAKASVETETKLQALTPFRPSPFPGGRIMHKPLAFLGLTWFALRDKLGF